jgi:hypothetical protein
MKGNRQGFDAQINLYAPSGNLPRGGAYVGLVGAATASSSDNGTGLTPATVGGAVWGANLYAAISGAARNFGGVVGLEINTALGSGTTAGNMIGVQVVPTSSHQVHGAYGIDIGYLLAAQTNAAGLDYGFLCGPPFAAWPLASTGTILAALEPNTRNVAQARAAWGIDFVGPMFSAGFARSIGFVVDGGGAVAAASLGIPGLAISQSGATASIGTIAGQQVSAISSVQAPGGGYWYPGDKVSFGTTGIGLVQTVRVVSATIGQGSPGSGGTNGAQTVTGTTGTGTKFQASVTIAGGAITSVNSVSAAGNYTTMPGSWNANNHLIDPVTGAGLVGASLEIITGVGTVAQLQPDRTASPPSNPVAATATNNFGGGLFSGVPSGLTLNLAYTAVTTLALQPGGGPATFGGTVSVSGALSGAGITALLAPYAPLASPVFTGAPVLPTGTTGVTQTAGTNNTTLATTAFVAAAAGLYLPLAGGTVSGATTFSAAGTALSVTNNATLGGVTTLGSGAQNITTITPGSSAAVAIQFAQSGTAGFKFGTAADAPIAAGGGTFNGLTVTLGTNILQAGNAVGTNNVIRLTPAAAGSTPTLTVIGPDANVNLALATQGTGGFQFNSRVGFNNTAPAAKPTVSGAKGSNAALGSLLTALVSYGLITDTTTT